MRRTLLLLVALGGACGAQIDQAPPPDPPPPAPPQPAAGAPAGAATFAAIGEADGPDDGAGYRLIIGTLAAPGTGRIEVIRKHAGAPESCRFEVVSALVVEIEARPEFARGTAIELPHRSHEPGKADWLNAVHTCSSAASCGEVTTGSVQMATLTPGTGAKGTYQFQTTTGPVVGSFDATWCASPSAAAP